MFPEIKSAFRGWNATRIIFPALIAALMACVAAEVARYRAAGITLPDATPGVLPNSVRTSISADQAFGLSIQLIQFKK